MAQLIITIISMIMIMIIIIIIVISNSINIIDCPRATYWKVCGDFALASPGFRV